MIEAKNADSPYLDKSREDLLDSLGMTKDEGNESLPTTTGLLFVGNQTALRELPFYEVKYIHYFEDGTYKPYEYKGNIIEVAKSCFAQLKAEIKQKEYIFGLFREYVEDYSKNVIERLCGLEFIEPSGKTSGLSYILHVSKRKDMDDKIDYVKSKKQEKARQKEAILRYLDSIPTINNAEARQLLSLQEKDRSKVSRLFAELISENVIVQTEDSVANNVKYRRLKG